MAGAVHAGIGQQNTAVKGALESIFGPLDIQPLASQIFGFYAGLAYFMPVLGGLIAGILLASWNYKHVAILLGRIITAPATAEMVAFLLIIIGVMILCTLIGKALNHTAHAIGLGFFDRLLGAVFGFARRSRRSSSASKSRPCAIRSRPRA